MSWECFARLAVTYERVRHVTRVATVCCFSRRRTPALTPVCALARLCFSAAGIEGATLVVPLDDKPARARSRPMQIRLMPGTLDPRGRSQSPPEIADVLAAAAGAAAAVGVAPLEPLQPPQPPEGLAPQLPPQLPHVPPARVRRPQSHLQLQVDGQQHEGLTPDMLNLHVSDSGHSTRATSADGGASETSSGVAGRMLPRSSGGVLGSYASGPLLSVPAAAASAASVVPAAAAEAALSHYQQQELCRGYARQTPLSATTSSPSTAVVEVPVLRQQSGRQQPQQQHQQPLQHTRPSQQAQPPMAVHCWPPPSSGQHHHQPQQSSRSDEYASCEGSSQAAVVAQLRAHASAPAAMALRRSSPGVTVRGAGGAQGGLQVAPDHGQSYYQQPQPQRQVQQVQEQQQMDQDSFGCGDLRDLHAGHMPQSHVRSLCSASALSDNLRFAHPQQHALRQSQQSQQQHQHQQMPLQHSSSWHHQQTQQHQQTQPEVVDFTMDDGPMPARPARHMRSGGDNNFGGHRCSAPGNIAAAHDGVPVLDNYQDACYRWRPSPSQPHAMVAQQHQHQHQPQHQPQGHARRPADSAAPYSLPHQPQSRAPLARPLPQAASEAWRQQPNGRQPYHMQPQQQQQQRRDLLQLSLQADMAAAPAAAAAAVDRMPVEGLGGHYAAAAAAAGSQELTLPYRQSRVTLVEPVLQLHPHSQQHQPQTRQPCHQYPRHQQQPEQQQQQQQQQTEHPQQTEQVLQVPHQQRWVQQPQPQPQQQQQLFEDDYAMADAAAAAVGTQDEGQFLSAAQLVPPPARQLPLRTQMEGRQQQLQQHQGLQQERHPDTGSTTEVLRSIILKLAHEQDQQQRV